MAPSSPGRGRMRGIRSPGWLGDGNSRGKKRTILNYNFLLLRFFLCRPEALSSRSKPRAASLQRSRGTPHAGRAENGRHYFADSPDQMEQGIPGGCQLEMASALSTGGAALFRPLTWRR